MVSHSLAESLVLKLPRVECTLLARHAQGYADPWLILTDLPSEHTNPCWYAMRCWIECLFKDGKRGGFCWTIPLLCPYNLENNIFNPSVIVG